jgi:Fe-S-cluster containining protein
MMDIPGILPASLLAERLEVLAYLYRRADVAVNEFVQASGVSCGFGCGLCCEGFVPDILPLEASYIAAWLVGTDREKAYRIAASGLSPIAQPDSRQGCPLYAADTPYHCTVYEARPLICRMFAFSGIRNKHGTASFSVCRHGHSAGAARAASGHDELIRVFGAEPPVMADMGSELAGIDPATSGERISLDRAVPEAVARVLFLVGMKDDDPLDGGPDLSPPMPQAG